MSNEQNSERIPEETPEATEGHAEVDEQKTSEACAPASCGCAPPQAESCQAGTCSFGRVLLVVCLLASLGFNAFLVYRLRTALATVDEQLARIWLKDQRDVLLVPNPSTKAVTSAHFQNRKLDEQTLQRTADLFRLSSIHLGETNITDEQLKYLSGLSQLASLVLSNTEISDKGLPHLKSLRNLEILHLPATKITNDGLKTLARLPKLAVLDVSNTAVNDEGLKHLRGVDSLQWLLLADNDITDKGLKELEKFKGLKRLTVSNTQVTSQGKKALMKANPNLAIDHLMGKQPGDEPEGLGEDQGNPPIQEEQKPADKPQE